MTGEFTASEAENICYQVPYRESLQTNLTGWECVTILTEHVEKHILHVCNMTCNMKTESKESGIEKMKVREATQVKKVEGNSS